jgi:hypothetical protein
MKPIWATQNLPAVAVIGGSPPRARLIPSARSTSLYRSYPRAELGVALPPGFFQRHHGVLLVGAAHDGIKAERRGSLPTTPWPTTTRRRALAAERR